MNNTYYLNKIGLGSVQFGLNYGISNNNGITKKEEVSKIFNISSEMGIKLIDTAQVYGNAENIIGKYHNNRFDIVTKLNPNKKNDLTIKKLLESSFNNLNINSIYGVIFHDVNTIFETPKFYNELITLKKQGFIEKIGFSLYYPDEIKKVLELFGEPDILQVPYNFFDRRFEKELIKLNNKNIEIHSRSTFLQGLFLSNPKIYPHTLIK